MLTNLSLANDARYLIEVLAIIVFIVAIIQEGINLKEITLVLGLLGISLIIYLFSKNMQPTYFVLVAFAFRKEAISKIIKGFFIVYTILLFSVLFLLKMGLVSSIIQYNSISGLQKPSLGFEQANALGLVLFIVLISNLYLKSIKERTKDEKFTLRVIDYSFQIFLIYLLYVSGMRSAQFAVLIAYVYYFILKIKNQKSKRKIMISLTYLLTISSVLFSIFSINNQVLTQGSFWYNLDALLSYRLSMGYLYYLQSGLSLFGKPFASISTNLYQTNITVDNVFQHALFNLGIIFCIGALIYFSLIIKKVIEKNQLTLLIPLVSFFVYGLGESSILYFYAGFIFYFAPILYQSYLDINNHQELTKIKLEEEI